MTPETSPPHQTPASGPDGRRPPRPGTGAACALLITLVVTAALCFLVVGLAPPDQRPALAWTGGTAAVLLCAAVTVAAHSALTARRLRATVAAKDAAAAAREASATRFAEATVPALVRSLREGASAETALAAAPPAENEAQRWVLVTLATEVHRSESLRASAMSACANAAGRVQALATSMAADLREMEHRHTDEDVLGDLLHLDHRNAQTGRLADCIAVLTGARSGRRWAKPIVMESILRGALGRISGYQRVRLHSTSTAAIAGHAAEGVMHALAELMDNAANFSPPTSEVHVYVEEVSAGVVITVEDGGLVMGEVALRRAQQAVSTESLDLTTLSGTRLGLAVVGRLARKHGLSISFRPSAHGGTGVVLRIPPELVTETRAEDAPGQRRAGAPATAAPEISATPGAPAPPGAPATAGASGAPGAPAPEPPRPAAVPGPRASAPAGPSAAPPLGTPSPGAPGPAGARTDGSGTDGARADGSGADRTAPVEYGDSGLPKRRRGQTLASASRRARAGGGGATPQGRSAEQSGNRFGAFRRAVRGDGTSGAATGGAKAGDGSAVPAPAPPRAPSPSPASSRSEDDTE